MPTFLVVSSSPNQSASDSQPWSSKDVWHDSPKIMSTNKTALNIPRMTTAKTQNPKNVPSSIVRIGMNRVAISKLQRFTHPNSLSGKLTVCYGTSLGNWFTMIYYMLYYMIYLIVLLWDITIFFTYFEVNHRGFNATWQLFGLKLPGNLQVDVTRLHLAATRNGRFGFGWGKHTKQLAGSLEDFKVYWLNPCVSRKIMWPAKKDRMLIVMCEFVLYKNVTQMSQTRVGTMLTVSVNGHFHEDFHCQVTGRLSIKDSLSDDETPRILAPYWPIMW